MLIFFNFDFGLLAGIDVMLVPKFGLRASYFYGLTDVIKDADSIQNYKNRGVGLCLITKIQ